MNMHAMSCCSWRWLWERIGLCTHACSSAVSRVSRMLHLVQINITKNRQESALMEYTCVVDKNGSYKLCRQTLNSHAFIIDCVTRFRYLESIFSNGSTVPCGPTFYSSEHLAQYRKGLHLVCMPNPNETNKV